MKDPSPLKILAVWSLIPTYMLGGGALGYGLDRWLSTFPYLTLVCLLVGFGFAIRDMLRLRRDLER
jgi:F0F1-type ATP synthase assembly protein I